MKYTLLCLIAICAIPLTAQATHSATLTWSDTQNPASTTYSVQRATGLCSGTPVYSTIATAVTVKTYTDATVTPGNYCYVVLAVYAGVTSPPSNTASAAVPTFAPQTLSVTVQ
jgi:hypothetical protein